MTATSPTGQQHLLFVCSRNQRRSVLAERLLARSPMYAVRSAGTERGAAQEVTRDHIDWADFIFAMELKHLQQLRSRFKPALKGKRLICLQIQDRYGGMSLELEQELRKKLSFYIEVPE